MDSTWLPNLFLDHESSDVQVRIHTTDQDSEALVPAHSLVLKFASKVFRAMLETTNFEEVRTGIVELKVKGNMDDAIFFLRYLYTRDLEHLDMNVYISVLQTAHLYEVDDLVWLCNERIVEQLGPLTVCRVYRSLKNVASEDLLAHCKNLMLEFAFLIFKKNLHLTLNEETLGFLLASDKLNVLNEEQALIALWRWGCTQLALKGCPENSVEMEIKKILVFIRRPLLTNVSESSPWFRLWRDMKTGTEGLTSNSSLVSGVLTRQPNKENKLNRFCQVACLSSVANDTREKTPKGNDNCMMIFSLDQNILFSGFTVQVTVGEKLTSQDIFQFSVSQEDVAQLESPEMVLTNKYTTQTVTANDKFKNLRQMEMMRHLSQNEAHNHQSIIPVVKKFYVYDLTVNLRTPIVLKTAERTVLDLSINQMPVSGVSFTNFMFPKNHTIKFNRSLKVRLWQDVVWISKLYYFV